MIVSINQPAYLPWLGYFERILLSDIHIVLDDVQFEKNSMTNRNRVFTNGQVVTLTIPLKTSGRFGNLAIKDVEIDHSRNWIKKHRKTINQAYAKTPFYTEFMPILDDFFNTADQCKFLGECIRKNTETLLDYLGIQKSIIYASEIHYSGKKSDLVLDLCKKFNANTYISGPFGRDYLDINSFRESNIDLLFHDYQHPEYPQKSDHFISHLSVLDLIFNCGKNAVRYLDKKEFSATNPLTNIREQ